MEPQRLARNKLYAPGETGRLGARNDALKAGCRMRIGNVFVAVSLGVMSSLGVLGQNPVYQQPVKEISVHATILALSTAVHQNFAGNEYTYIAEVSLPKQGQQVVKLVDKFPASQNPIRPDLLVNHHSFRMTITRDYTCDGAFLGNESQIYDPSSVKALTAEERAQMPCYRIKHDATRLAK